MTGEILGASDLLANREVSCDVCVVGSGAGGAVAAAGLARRGMTVVVLEEGGHRTAADFQALDEAVNYPMLYQERATRATADQAITILQGRSVGGSTTVNWTTCFRTPERILHHWRDVHGIDTLSPGVLAPHFDAIEARLNIHPWPAQSINPGNRALLDGCERLGWSAEVIRRNVKGCQASGYCGFGCPFDAKQGMHLTYIPDAVEAGTVVFADTRAERLVVVGDRVVAVEARVLEPDADRAGSVRVVVRPKVVVCAGGAINSPALLLRSGLDHGPVGRRTFLHPVIAVAGRYPHAIHPWYGAPQSVSSHQFIDRGLERVGFFLETAPMHPMLSALAFPQFGAAHAELMGRLSHTAGLIALHVDGVLPGDEGGTVSLRSDGRVRVDYPVGPALIEAMGASHSVLSQVHLAAGAEEVATAHLVSPRMRNEADLIALEALPYGALEHSIFTAHQMGGCAMGPDPATSVVDPHLRHHQVPNLFVVDGSVLPTSLGVNPSETIYAIANWATDGVASAV